MGASLPRTILAHMQLSCKQNYSRAGAPEKPAQPFIVQAEDYPYSSKLRNKSYVIAAEALPGRQCAKESERLLRCQILDNRHRKCRHRRCPYLLIGADSVLRSFFGLLPYRQACGQDNRCREGGKSNESKPHSFL